MITLHDTVTVDVIAVAPDDTLVGVATTTDLMKAVSQYGLAG